MPVVLQRSKRYKKAAEKAVTTPVSAEQAVTAVKAFPPTKFDQSVELIFSLGIDAKQADQMIRGSLSLPHGVGKTKRVVAFCPDHLAPQATEAGAIRAGGQELVADIEKNNFTDFDVAIATPDMMPVVGKLGRVLGPQGKMPNPKVGTVTNDVTKAVSEAKAGKIEYRTDRTAIVHLPIGKASFEASALVENFAALIDEVNRSKPASAKGRYLETVTLTTTMGPGVRVDASATADRAGEVAAAVA